MAFGSSTRCWLLLIACSFSLSPVLCAKRTPEQPVKVVANTGYGSIRGLCSANYGHCSFKGIPYAQVVSRFAASIPVTPWAPATINGYNFGAVCPQATPLSPPIPKNFSMSENCLSLNIWTPSGVFLSSKTENLLNNLPVIFFIHGGSFVEGTGSDPLFWSDFYTNTTNTIVVTINYRLGALGFLSSSQLGLSGNYGFLDQQLALKFVQQNIAFFGGNPNAVALAGQSAGAMSVMAHMVTSSSWPLYSYAIMESNPASMLFRNTSENSVLAFNLAKKLNCTTANQTIDMNCLITQPYQNIVQAQQNLQTLQIPINSTMFLTWGLNIDGVLFTQQPFHELLNGGFKKTPFLLGTVRNESDSFIPNVAIDSDAYTKFLTLVFGNYTSQVLQMYPPMGNNSRDQLSMLGTDYFWNCPSRAMALTLANNGNNSQSTYLYQFFHTPSVDPSNPSPQCKQNPCHSADIPYWFHSQKYANATWTAEESGLSLTMLSLWAQFVKNPSVAPVFSSTLNWSPYVSSSNSSIVLDLPNTTITQNYRASECDFWDSIGYWF